MNGYHPVIIVENPCYTTKEGYIVLNPVRIVICAGFYLYLHHETNCEIKKRRVDALNAKIIELQSLQPELEINSRFSCFDFFIFETTVTQ